MTEDHLREVISNRINDLCTTQRKVSESAGINQSCLSRFLRGKAGLNGDSMLRVFVALGLEIKITEKEV